jgi:hypothetical protein
MITGSGHQEYMVTLTVYQCQSFKLMWKENKEKFKNPLLAGELNNLLFMTGKNRPNISKTSLTPLTKII